MSGTHGPGADLVEADRRLESVLDAADPVPGHLSRREMRFLARAAAFPTAGGDILEIGSFRGRSTVVLALASALGDGARVHACDPLTSPSSTDPPRGGTARTNREEVEATFRAAGVADRVTLHQVLSGELARTWDAPLRLLWIDGDHTVAGARADLAGFLPHVQDGGIVAFHDVLNPFAGPARVVADDVLASGAFGAAGFVGSIAWAQVARDAAAARRHAGLRAQLRELLLPVADLVARELGPLRRLRWKLARSRVPHSEPALADWLALVAPEAITSRSSR